jgi:signal transduction histidine kinase
MVRADLGMIERVLTNLFDNAIRHTPAGGEVEITVAGGAGKVEVTVADTGPGVPAALRENLFRRPVALQGEYRVGGLGLLTVNRILQLHHSKIELVSEAGRRGVPLYAGCSVSGCATRSGSAAASCRGCGGTWR